MNVHISNIFVLWWYGFFILYHNIENVKKHPWQNKALFETIHRSIQCNLFYKISKATSIRFILLSSLKYIIAYKIEWRTVYVLTRGSFGVYFPSWAALAVRHESTHIILFHTQTNESIPDDKNEEHHSSSPCLTRSAYVLLVTSQSVADDVTITRRLWRDHVKSDI